MPIFCSKCKQFFVEIDTLVQVIEHDILGYKQYTYYHQTHCPEGLKQIKSMTGKELYNLVLGKTFKRICEVCGNDIESTRPNRNTCTNCGRVKAYKTPEFKRAYMKAWRLKNKERKMSSDTH